MRTTIARSFATKTIQTEMLEMSGSPWLDARPPAVVSLVTTVDGHGRGNASPKVWWMPTSYEPPLVLLSLKPETDTAKNIEETGLFCLQIPDCEDFVSTTAVLHTAKPLPRGENELDDVGFHWEWLRHEKLERPLPYIHSWPWFVCWASWTQVTGDHILVCGQVGLAGGFVPAEYKTEDLDGDSFQSYTGGIGDVLLHRGRNVFMNATRDLQFSVPPYVYERES